MSVCDGKERVVMSVECVCAWAANSSGKPDPACEGWWRRRQGNPQKIENQNVMEIKEVVTKKDLRTFVRFPRQLYQGCPYYVPALDKAEIKLLTEHPALAFCTQKLWMAYRDGKVVGRIAGIVNRKCNELKEQRRVRFGWFDVIDDEEVAHALLSTVEAWGREQGMDTISGPSRYSNMEKQSMLVEGFDRMPSIGSDYNYSYYPKLVEKFGFEKEVDYIQYKVKVNEVPERMTRMADLLSKRYHVRLRKFRDKEEMKASGRALFGVLNQCYTQIYNFIPLTDEEIEWTVADNFQVADKDLFMILEDENGKAVGFAFALPSLSEAFRKANGSLFPFGWWHVLRALKKNKTIDLYLTGVLPEYIHTGIHAIYHQKLHENAIAKGYEYALTSQQLEDNVAARIWERYDSEVVFRRRCYKKSLND